MPDSRFPCERVGGIPVVVVTQDAVDITNADGLRAALFECSGQGNGILIVDMSRTRFCDTAGLHALVGAHKQAQAQGGEVRVVISGAGVQRILALTGLDQVIPCFTSLREALPLGAGGRMKADRRERLMPRITPNGGSARARSRLARRERARAARLGAYGRFHRWLVLPVQSQICNWVPGVVEKFVSSRHLLDCGL